MAGTAAIIFTMLMAALAVLQLALVLGAPLGHFAWGGQHRVLPPGLRIGSAVAVGLYALFSIIMLMGAGLVPVWPAADWVDPALWAVAAYMGLGIVVNAISRSLPERLVMTPVCAALCVCAVLVALG